MNSDGDFTATEATGISSSTAAKIIIVSVVACLPIFVHYFYSVPLPLGVPLIREPLGKRTFSFATRQKYITECEQIYQEAYNDVRLFCFEGIRNYTYDILVYVKRPRGHRSRNRNTLRASFAIIVNPLGTFAARERAWGQRRFRGD